jgi:PAS domain S-box-containing protein
MQPTSIDPGSLDDPSVLMSVLDASTEFSIVATRLDGTLVLWNEGARKIYGYGPEEVLGRNIRLLHPTADIEAGRVDSIFAAALEDGKWEGVVHRVRKGGLRFPTRIVLTVRRGTAGEPVGFLSVSQDLSDELHLNERLLVSEEYNRVLIESTIDGIFTIDRNGVLTDLNKPMESVTGVPREKMVGRPFREFVVPAADADRAIRRVLSEGHAAGLELCVRRADGSVRDFAFNASILSGDPYPGGIVATVRDVTDQKHLREVLEAQNRELQAQNERIVEANRLKSEFLASMSHELRTPLNSIIGFSDFLLTSEDDPLGPAQREYLTDILNSGNHLLQLINDVLDLAKVESGKLELAPTAVDLREAVDEVCSSLRPQLMERRLDLHSDVDAGLPRVVLDPLRFKQILYNLLSNAVKFTPRGGRIEVSVAPSSGSRFALRVSDSGIGIPPNEIGRIFREFEQLDTGPGRRFSGTGLGLPLTQKLVDLMGGSISVKSEVGEGSMFTVRLPLVPAPLPPIDAPNESVRA